MTRQIEIYRLFEQHPGTYFVGLRDTHKPEQSYMALVFFDSDSGLRRGAVRVQTETGWKNLPQCGPLRKQLGEQALQAVSQWVGPDLNAGFQAVLAQAQVTRYHNDLSPDELINDALSNMLHCAADTDITPENLYERAMRALARHEQWGIGSNMSAEALPALPTALAGIAAADGIDDREEAFNVVQEHHSDARLRRDADSLDEEMVLLLQDLAHWCHRAGLQYQVDFEHCWRIALLHFGEERGPGHDELDAQAPADDGPAP